MSDEPEQQRIAALLDRVSTGAVTEAESEELALYVGDHPELRAQIDTRARQAQLGEGWLARVEADHNLARMESSRGVRVERGIGLALVVGGFALSPFVATVGPVLLALGLLVVAWSFVRLRLATHQHDPYKDVQR